MPLVKATVSSTIVIALQAETGVPADAAEQKKFADSLADALITILTSQVTANITAPVDSGGDTMAPGVTIT